MEGTENINHKLKAFLVKSGVSYTCAFSTDEKGKTSNIFTSMIRQVFLGIFSSV